MASFELLHLVGAVTDFQDLTSRRTGSHRNNRFRYMYVVRVAELRVPSTWLGNVSHAQAARFVHQVVAQYSRYTCISLESPLPIYIARQ